MPLYEYQCDACGHRFETIQKFSDPLVDKCPVCGARVHKLPSSPAIQFKGSGFYITDYPKKDQGGTSKTESAESKADSKSESKTESKADSSGDAKSPSTAGTKADKAEKKTASSGDTTPSTSTPKS